MKISAKTLKLSRKCKRKGVIHMFCVVWPSRMIHSDFSMGCFKFIKSFTSCCSPNLQ